MGHEPEPRRRRENFLSPVKEVDASFPAATKERRTLVRTQNPYITHHLYVTNSLVH